MLSGFWGRLISPIKSSWEQEKRGQQTWFCGSKFTGILFMFFLLWKKKYQGLFSPRLPLNVFPSWKQVFCFGFDTLTPPHTHMHMHAHLWSVVLWLWAGKFVVLHATATTNHSVLCRAVAILPDCNLARSLRFPTRDGMKWHVRVCVCLRSH